MGHFERLFQAMVEWLAHIAPATLSILAGALVIAQGFYSRRVYKHASEASREAMLREIQMVLEYMRRQFYLLSAAKLTPEEIREQLELSAKEIDALRARVKAEDEAGEADHDPITKLARLTLAYVGNRDDLELPPQKPAYDRS